MSIIEETLRNLQEKKENEDVPVAQVVERKASPNVKPSRSRTFVAIAIVTISRFCISLAGLGTSGIILSILSGMSIVVSSTTSFSTG